MPNGKYTKNLVISRTYREGSAIKAKVELTANHNGFFLFKLCPTKTDKKEVTQKCLNRFPLEVLNSVTSDKYVVPSKRAQMFTIELKLPKGLTCQRCVFQWTYICANNWGKCENGSSAVGCGPQETFRGCADVKIVGQNEEIIDTTTPTPELSTKSKDQDRLNLIEDESIDFINHSNPETTSSERQFTKSCGSTGIWKRVANMDEWCKVNCQANFCPPTHCSCDRK